MPCPPSKLPGMGLTNPTHLLVLVVIIALVFGSSKLPGMARSAGKHAREAKDGMATVKGEFESVVGEGNPIADVVDTVRSANPRTIVKDTVTRAASPSKPATKPVVKRVVKPSARTPPKMPPKKP